MLEVRVYDNDLMSAIKRLRHKVRQDGVVRILKDRTAKPSEKRREKAHRALRRRKKMAARRARRNLAH